MMIDEQATNNSKNLNGMSRDIQLSWYWHNIRKNQTNGHASKELVFIIQQKKSLHDPN